jgi:hypothetical protein
VMDVFKSYDQGRSGSHDVQNRIVQVFEDEHLNIRVHYNEGQHMVQGLDSFAILISRLPHSVGAIMTSELADSASMCGDVWDRGRVITNDS